MQQDVASNIGTHGTPLGGKAWTAYIGPVLLALILFGAALPLAFHWSEWAAAGVMVFTVLVVGYRVLLLRSYQLYYDDVGVWLYRGILPWSKGLVGVKWRDMDEADVRAVVLELAAALVHDTGRPPLHQVERDRHDAKWPAARTPSPSSIRSCKI